MALSNYTELQAAVRTELANVSTGGITDDSIQDAIARAEAKINRRTRSRHQQTLATDTMTSASRFVDAPTGMMEWITVRTKKASEADTEYLDARYVGSERIADYYDEIADPDCFWFTMRQQFEFAQAVTVDHTIQFDYIKRWDIATDSTNWLLTNFPDIYLYGACMEATIHMRDQEGIPMTVWKTLFDEGVKEFNNLEDRNKDDAEADLREATLMASNGHYYNILRG